MCGGAFSYYEPVDMGTYKPFDYGKASLKPKTAKRTATKRKVAKKAVRKTTAKKVAKKRGVKR